ncbi:MAG TPA: VOC family protein [Candidatus Limnocylindria bacterium]|nr:VOC family protein [Candidatus Limnocylindria bacterium]
MSTPITGIHHAAVNVSDWDRSVAFYRDVLGFELIFQDGSASGRELDQNTKLANVQLRFGMVRAGETLFELIQYEHPSPGPNDGSINDTGRTHLCFRVADIEAAYAELSERGVRFNGRPLHIDSGPLAGCAFAYFPDPDGVLLEIFEDNRQRAGAS